MAAERAQSAEDFLPRKGRRSLPQLARAAAACEGCELHKAATQVVFGEGSRGATMVLVGEQPGDKEDRQGRPFVGPAGRLLDEALAEAGIARSEVYVTNAVKHFAFVERGKRRIHQKPKMRHVRACEAWLRCELEAVGPRVTVALGATAGRALLGPGYRVTKSRGVPVESAWPGGPVVGTIHPSALLRLPRGSDRRGPMEELVRDLAGARAVVEGG